MKLRLPALFALATFASFVCGAFAERFFGPSSRVVGTPPKWVKVVTYAKDVNLGDEIPNPFEGFAFRWVRENDVPEGAAFVLPEANVCVKRSFKAGRIVANDDFLRAGGSVPWNRPGYMSCGVRVPYEVAKDFEGRRMINLDLIAKRVGGSESIAQRAELQGIDHVVKENSHPNGDWILVVALTREQALNMSAARDNGTLVVRISDNAHCPSGPRFVMADARPTEKDTDAAEFQRKSLTP